MRVVVIYKPNDENTSQVEVFLRDFSRQTGRTLESMDPESREGADFCRTYDIVEYPSLVALSDDGQVQNLWKGLPLPTISEVSYYA